MDEANDLPALAIATPKVYERHAERFDCERPKSLVERAWLSRSLYTAARFGQDSRCRTWGG